MAQPQFLIDTNCLITPNNDYYRPSYSLSQQFWEHLGQLVINDNVGVLSLVSNEASVDKYSDDFLENWLQSIRSKVIEPDKNPSIVAKFAEIMRFVASSNFSPKARQSWMREGVADPWLVATAAIYGSRIITFEKYVKLNPKQPANGAKIPNVAQHFGVQCVSLFDFMAVEGNF